MKDYYQSKGIWRIDDNVFRQTYYFIRQYPKWLRLRDGNKETKKFINQVENVAVNAADAKANIEVVDKALRNFVSQEFREAVMAHIVEGLNYNQIEARYGVSQEDIKEYRSRLIYAVAEDMGWNYF